MDKEYFSVLHDSDGYVGYVKTLDSRGEADNVT